MMFTVLGYQYENKDLLEALSAVRRHLDKDGLFIFDVWNGIALLADRPRARSVERMEGATRIVRSSRTDLDIAQQRCHVQFHMERTTNGGATESWDEDHTLRFFFPQELSLALYVSGFDLVDLAAFRMAKLRPMTRVEYCGRR